MKEEKQSQNELPKKLGLTFNLYYIPTKNWVIRMSKHGIGQVSGFDKSESRFVNTTRSPER